MNRSRKRIAAIGAAAMVLALAVSACTAAAPKPTVIYKYLTPPPASDSPTPVDTSSDGYAGECRAHADCFGHALTVALSQPHATRRGLLRDGRYAGFLRSGGQAAQVRRLLRPRPQRLAFRQRLECLPQCQQADRHVRGQEQCHDRHSGRRLLHDRGKRLRPWHVAGFGEVRRPERRPVHTRAQLGLRDLRQSRHYQRIHGDGNQRNAVDIRQHRGGSHPGAEDLIDGTCEPATHVGPVRTS